MSVQGEGEGGATPVTHPLGPPRQQKISKGQENYIGTIGKIQMSQLLENISKV